VSSAWPEVGVVVPPAVPHVDVTRDGTTRRQHHGVDDLFVELAPQLIPSRRTRFARRGVGEHGRGQKIRSSGLAITIRAVTTRATHWRTPGS